MKVNKKIILIALIFVALSIVLPSKVKAAVTASELQSKFNSIRNTAGYRENEEYKWNSAGYFSDYCTSGGYHSNVGYYNMGYECYAYSQDLFDQLFKQCGTCHASTTKGVNDLYVGDVVRTTYGHSIVVTNIVGDTIYYTDANANFDGKVHWDQQMEKSYLSSRITWISHADGNNVKTLSDAEKPKIVDSGVDMSSITTTSFKVRVKATDNVGVTSVGFNIWAPNQNQVWKGASYNSSTGYWEYTIKKSDFNNASGLYRFDTYVFDAAGNSVNQTYSSFPMGTTVEKNLGEFTARIALKANSNYVLGTDGTTNLSNVILSTKSLSDNSQLWKFTKNSDNTYTITHVKSGKVLDIDNYSNSNNTKVQIYTKGNGSGANFGTNQRFYIMSYNGGYRIVPQCSNDVKGIDNTDGKITNGNKIELYEAYTINNVAQTWTFEKVATSISIAQTSATLKVGETKTLNKTLSPTGVATTTVKWTSSDSSVVTVNTTGQITAKKAGTATITVATTDGTNLTATCKVTVTSLPFIDVKVGDWYYDAVKYAYTNNIVSGTSSTTFSPNEKVTRGMLVTMLHKMEGTPYVAGTSKFSDVKDTNAYYYMAVKWATQNGIVSGYENGKFGPNDNITREQLAVILNKYCKYKNKYQAQANILSQFKDANKISNFAYWGMQWATGAGVITGSNGELNPQGTATRAEVVSMIYKYCLNIK